VTSLHGAATAQENTSTGCMGDDGCELLTVSFLFWMKTNQVNEKRLISRKWKIQIGIP
jgi:hypothetical protein